MSDRYGSETLDLDGFKARRDWHAEYGSYLTVLRDGKVLKHGPVWGPEWKEVAQRWIAELK